MRGSWKLSVGDDVAAIDCFPFLPLKPRERAELEAEAAALLAALAPGRRAAITVKAAAEG
ncbi:MAG: hypothetical protein P4M09_12665 [Devosia sp.]|nr:hypothetical protein [Devosia sp.]